VPEPDVLVQHTGISQAELAELLSLARGTELTELHVRVGSASITLRRPATPLGAPESDEDEALAAEPATAEETRVAVTAPLVGIFRASIEDGAVASIGQQIGAIEALGMPTTIEAPQAGVVDAVLVRDGPVEYGQPLVLLLRQPAGEASA
jgi:biotin carboxyl carrier protein